MSKSKQNKRDDLGDRMKRYEEVTRFILPLNSYYIVRVDGKAFHTHTKGMERPFDYDFVQNMNAATLQTCKRLHNVVLAYVQSDEVSFLLTDFEKHEKTPYLGGVVQKIASITAATMSVEYNKVAQACEVFDGRVFSLPNTVEVYNYLLWRQQDAMRNSISSLAQSLYSSKELHGVSSPNMVQMCDAKGVRWNDLPGSVRFGRLVYQKETYGHVTFFHKGKQKEVTTKDPVKHHEWVIEALNGSFGTNLNAFIRELIPEP